MHQQQRSTFHVVCHSCTFESLVSTQAEARELRDHHEGTTTHAIRYARID